jgi:hypothetical protein
MGNAASTALSAEVTGRRSGCVAGAPNTSDASPSHRSPGSAVSLTSA